MSSDRTSGVPLDATKVFADRARTFSFAARSLPREPFNATLRLYSFFRTLDDIVDESDLGPDEKYDVLQGWRSWLRGGVPPDGGEQLAATVLPVLDQYAVPRWLLEAFLDGMAFDVQPVRVDTFERLYRYSFQVAGTVGLAMAYVLGASDPRALRCAANLGVAMQLTNILRDVGSDLARDRIYLPANELATFGYSAGRLFDTWEGRVPQDESFRHFLRFQTARARAYYERGLAGIGYLPPATQPAILLAGRLYRMILDQILSNPEAPLHCRAATSRLQKVQEALLCRFVHRRRVGAMRLRAEDWDATTELAWLDLTLDQERYPIPAAPHDSQAA